MKLIFFTNYYSCLPLAQRCNKEIDTYVCYLGKKLLGWDKTGDGLINKITFKQLVDYLTRRPKDDIPVFIFDFNFYPELSDELRKKGYPVLGDGKFNYTLEKDRMIGINFMKYCGINIPETHLFNSIQQGITFVKQNKSINWVFKPCGSDESDETLVAEDDVELIYKLNELAEKKGDKVDFILQKRIDGGIEISVEGWFADGKWLFFDATLERKRRLNDDLGENTGCAGDVVWLLDRDCKLVQEGIAKIGDFLKKINFNGMIDLNSIVNENGELYGIEWTPRFGYNASFSLFQLFNSSIPEFLIYIAFNKTPQNLDISDEFACSVRQYLHKNIADQIIEYSPAYENNIWLWAAYKKNGKIFTTEYDKEILVAIDRGKTIPEARENVYKIADKIKIIDIGYRTDIGVKAEKDFETLKKWGWI